MFIKPDGSQCGKAKGGYIINICSSIVFGENMPTGLRTVYQACRGRSVEGPV